MVNFNSYKSIFSRVISILFIFTLLFCSVSCGKSRDPKVVRVGYESILSDITFFIAQENGYFENEGLIIEATEFHTTNDQMFALLTGDVDMIPNSSMALILSAEHETPGQFLIFLAHGDIGNKLLVSTTSSMTSVTELSGKKVGIYPGTTMLTYAELSLSQYFSDAIAPEYIGMAPPSLVEAISSGQVDAILAPDPIATIALNSGVGYEILDNPLGNIISPFVGGSSLLSSDFVENNPETAAAVVAAMEQAVQFINENPEESIEIYASATNNSAELMAGMDIGSNWTLADLDREAFQDLADILFDTELVSAHIDTSTLFYTSGK